MILDYSSLIGRPQPTDPDDAWDAYTQAFADRCSAVVSAMGTLVSAYEIWNESDLPSVGNVPAQRFGPLLSAAYTAIHQAHDDTAKKVMMSGRKSRSMIRAGQDNVNANDADVTVVLGGLASGDPSYVTAVQTAAGGTLPADAIGLHPYGQRPTPDWPSPTWGFGVLTDLLSRFVCCTRARLLARWPALPQLAGNASALGNAPALAVVSLGWLVAQNKCHGARVLSWVRAAVCLLRYADVAQGKEIWITEIGTQDLDSQGEFPQRAFDAIVGTGVCKHVLWFCWCARGCVTRLLSWIDGTGGCFEGDACPFLSVTALCWIGIRSDGMVDKFGVLDTSGNKKASYESFQGWVHNNSETTTA